MPEEYQEDDRTRTHVVLTKGTMVSHYRIIEKIGAGGMGEVYLAEDTKLKRRAALKFLPDQYVADSDFKARFVREAEAAAKLDHPNVITIYEVSEYQGRPYFAMQLVEGQSLRELSKDRELSVDRIIELAIQICDGLAAAHDKKVVHRDIKPSNIVIDAYGRPKILDFGLAAIQGGEHLTKTGSTLGTVRYMSPEQVQGKEIDQRSDLFSLGIVLYEMISGRTPFERDNEAATLKSIAEDNPEPLTRYKSDVPDELQRTVSKLLEKDPSMRYQTAGGVISDLKRLIAPTQSSIAVSPVRRATRWPWWIGVVVTVAIIAVLAWQSFRPAQEGGRSEGKKMLAVLPFVNLGAPEDEYFADGITEEIMSRLARVRGLGVIARTSTIQYKGTRKTIQQIAEELGVDYILEGTIRWQKSPGEADLVRVTPQLIDVADATHLWAENYERELSAIFKVQADIASRIVEELGITLLQQERESLEEELTDNLEAYNFYLRGMYHKGKPDYAEDDIRLAVEMYKKAVELDPEFARAYVELSSAHSFIYHLGYDQTEERLARSKAAIDRALQLQPRAYLAHVVLGFYYYRGYRDYDRALEALATAEKYDPTRTKSTLAAYIWRRQGKFEEAAELLIERFELDPRKASLAYEIGTTFQCMRQYAEAERYYDRSISLAPEQTQAYETKAQNYELWHGDIARARATMEQILYKTDENRLPQLVWYDLLERDYQTALDRLLAASITSIENQNWFIPRALLIGLVHTYMDERDLARASFDSARILLEAEVKRRPDDHRIRSSLGITYAGLGRKEEAIREGKLGVELYPVSKDALSGPHRVADLALIYVMVSEYEAAIDQIEYLLSIPYEISVPALRIEPKWVPLRDHPRFQALLEKYE